MNVSAAQPTPRNSRGGGGGWHRGWAGNPKLKGAELLLASCFVTAIIYRRKLI